MWSNKFIILLLKSPLHFFISGNTMLMTIRGRNSGRIYQVPMNYLRMGNRLVTTSQPDRTWWRNLRGGADVKVRLKGRNMDAFAVVEEEHAKVTEILAEYLSLAPKLAEYYQVRIDQAGKPDPDDVARAAKERVIVITTVK